MKLDAPRHCALTPTTPRSPSAARSCASSEQAKPLGIVDLTRGELGSRGDRAARDRETAAANALLRLAVRHNLDLPDGRVRSRTSRSARASRA